MLASERAGRRQSPFPRPAKPSRVGEFGYGSRPVGCLPSWGTGRSSGTSSYTPKILIGIARRAVAAFTHEVTQLSFATPVLSTSPFLPPFHGGSTRELKGEVFAVSRGLPLPRAVSELRSTGAACSTTSPPAVPYTVSPVSKQLGNPTGVRLYRARRHHRSVRASG